jgi:1-acyl-sn-glycerol-3-phosphate acyltransferase
VNRTANSRGRLASLWLSQAARNLADNALRVFVILRVAEAGQAERDYAWHLCAALLMLPAVLLAPFNGALGNALPKRWVLTGSALYCCLVVAFFGLLDGPWLAAWALLAVGAAVYSPTRYALLPAASVDTHIPLTRVNGWIEMGAVMAIVGGLAIGFHLENLVWFDLPAAVSAAVGLNLLAVVTAIPAEFPADIRRAERSGQAIRGFFRDAVRIWHDDETRGALLGMACLRGLVAGATGAFVALLLNDQAAALETQIGARFDILAWILVGVAAGSFVASLQRHPRRALGLVPMGVTGLAVGLVLAITESPDPTVCVLLGMMGGLVKVPLAASYQISLPPDARGNGMAIRNLFDYLSMSTVALFLFEMARHQIIDAKGQMWLMAALAAAGAVVAWRTLFREAIEQILELLIWPIYRIKGRGTGLDTLPLRGPLLLVANHAAWFDPIWMAKVVPRSIRPMMTSIFYDLPFLRWLMKYIARAIRVQYSTFRREAPELQEAICALDNGECVLIFPEGSLRKSEERPLRHFGQGVWHILNERPQTPVAVCWIEGNWGSFFSYWKGNPTKNKRMDFWRHINIAVGEAHPLDSATVADLKATRAYLERQCREMRGVLGLEVPPADTGPEKEAETAMT